MRDELAAVANSEYLRSKTTKVISGASSYVEIKRTKREFYGKDYYIRYYYYTE